jgi:hypothetical protein
MTYSSLHHSFSLFSFVLVGITSAFADVPVFSDNFSRADLATGGPTTYTVSVTGDGGASISENSHLIITSNSTAAANVDGIGYVAGTTSSFASAYASRLDANTGLVTWTFNYKLTRGSNPSGFNAGASGGAIILGATGGDFTTANGYAIVYGQSGATDPFRLVSFTDGLDSNANLTNIVAPSPAANSIAAFGNYVSIRVTYDPLGSTWSLFVRDDGSVGWSDPATGVSTQIGTSVANTAYTAENLTHFGFLYNYPGENSSSSFDNFAVSVAAVPEPSAYTAIAGVIVLVAGLSVRRRSAC